MSCSKYLQRLSALIIALPIMFNMANAEPIVTDGSDYCLTDFNAYATVSEVQLRWAYSGAPQYNVYRSVDDGVSYQSIVQITSSDTSYLDSSLISGASYRYAVKEVDSNGLEICQSPVVHVTLKERSGNKPPVFISTPVLVAQASVVYHYDVDAIDKQDDPVRYSLKSFPAGMSIDSESGIITWIPVQTGDYSVTVRAIDDSGLYDQQGYMLNVSEGSNTNQAPQIVSTPVTNGTESQTYQYDVDATDAGDLLTYELSVAPVGMTIDAATGLITWIPVSGTAGLHDVTVSVRDQDGLTDTQSYQLGIAQENLAPVISSTPVTTATETLTYQYDVDATDPNTGDVINYALVTAPADMAIDSATGLIIWVPGQTDIGVYTVTVAAADPAGLTDSQSFTLQVLDINHPPSAADITVTTEEDVALIIVLQGMDIDGDSLTYSIVTQPLSEQLSGVMPDLVYTPTDDFNGSDSFTYRTHDGLLDSPVATVDVTVSSVNDAPMITSVAETGATEWQLYQYDVNATDPDLPVGDILTYRLDVSPVGMSIDGSSGLIQWIPGDNQVGDNAIVVLVTDSAGLSASQSFTISVTSLNAGPNITSAPVVMVTESAAYRYDVDAVDADGDQISYSLLSAPTDMSINSETGVIDWVPDAAMSIGILSLNNYCRVPASDEQQRPKAMDVVMVVDGSGSNQESWPWVAGAMASLDVDLQLSHVGIDPEQNRYGLVGFGTNPASRPFDGNLFGTITDLYEATYDGISPGGTGSAENGLRALQFTIDTYQFRDDVVRNLIWIPDEPQQGSLDNSETLEAFTQRLIDGNYNVNVITPLYLQCIDDGRTALGMDADGRGYVADGMGGFEYCEVDATAIYDATGGYRTGYVDPFILPALATGGGAWNLSAITSLNQQESLRKALTSRMFSTTIVNETERGLADLAVQSIGLTESPDGSINANIELINRGRAAIDTSMTVNLVDADNAGVVLGTQSLSNIAVGEERIVTIAMGNISLPANISIYLDTEQGIECLTDNNLVTAPVVQVQAADSHGDSDTQLFSITVQDDNQTPVINSAPELQAYVGQPYSYQVTFNDPDMGDDHQFTLTGNSRAVIDQDTGLFSYSADATDLGEQSFTISVADLSTAYDSQTFTLNVSGDYLTPKFNGPPDSGRAVINTPYQFVPSVTADPTAILVFSLLQSPAGMTVNPSDGTINWVADESDLNRLRLVTMIVVDQFHNKDTLSFMVFGDEPNQGPVITTDPNEMARLRTNYSYFFEYEDVNVREDFDLLLAATAPGLEATIYQNYGLDRLNSSISWSRYTLNGLYPRHLRDSDYLCQNPSVDHPSAAIPFTSLWEARATFVGRHLLAAPLTDTNSDGVINSRDRSAILMTYAAGSSTFLRAYDSLGGQPIWTHEFNGTNVRPSQYHVPAVADINTDGVPDILLVENSSRLLVAISSDDRRELWRSSVPVSDNGFTRGQITLTDLEGDGAPEILAGFALYDAQGNWLRSFQRPVSIPTYGLISPSYPVDLNLDGNQELVQGGVANSMTGSELWRVTFSDNHSSRLAYSAFANFDADLEPEMVHVERSDADATVATVSLLDSDGSFIWGPNSLQYVGQPIVGDLDGDGALDIFVSGEDVLLDHQGIEQWRLDGYTRQDGNIATAADIQGNGRSEIILHRQNGALILDALTGTEMAYVNAGYTEAKAKPLVADMDGDGKAELASATSSRIYLNTYTGDSVNPDMPRMMHQNWWQPQGLNEHLAVNPNMPSLWSGHNSDQIIVPSAISFDNGLPDLWVNAPQGDHRQSVNVQVVNRGTADYLGVLDVELFADDPENGGQLLGSQSLTGLAINETHTLQFNGLVPTDFIGELVARVAPQDSVLECQTNNNVASAYTIDLTLSDHAGATDTQNYLLGVEYHSGLNSMTVPTVPDVNEGELFELDYDILIRDYTDDNNRAFFYIYSGPEGLTIDADTGVVHWIPPYGSTGTHDVTIYANYLTGLSGRSLRINVLPASNYPPVIISTPQTGSFAFQPFSYDVQAEDPDGDTLIYSLTQSPAGMTIDSDSGLIQWTPDANGTFPVTVVVSDGTLQVTQNFTLTVEIPNLAPEITSTPPTSVLQGQSYQYQLSANDPEGDSISFALLTAPVGMQIDQATGLVTWTPATDQIGVYDIELSAADSQGNTASQSYLISVSNGAGNTPPAIVTNPTGNAIYDQAYGYDVNATDSDGDTLIYLLITAPAGMTIDSATGIIAWTPQTSQGGTHPVEIRVEDGRGGYAIQSYGLYASDDSTTNTLPIINLR